MALTGCDTFVCLQDFTADGSIIFAKNSDRDVNEAQALQYIPGKRHRSGDTVQCTYVSVPQVPETYGVLLSRPFWMYGAEMGINEHGVTIGNEAIVSRFPLNMQNDTLTGMDLLRLALERSQTAQQGMDIICSLLKTHGQGGNCGYDHRFFYHNAFLIADYQEAWILETYSREWIAKKVVGTASISNAPSIGTTFDRMSEGMPAFAATHGINLSTAGIPGDRLVTTFGRGRARRACTHDAVCADRQKGGVSVHGAMQILRSHSSPSSLQWSPVGSLFTQDVCMHAALAPIRNNNSTASMVVHLHNGHATVWVTGTSGPCLSIFKPLFMHALPGANDADHPLADVVGMLPGKSFVSLEARESLWWKGELLHRLVLNDYATATTIFRAERDAMESRFVTSVEQLLTKRVDPAKMKLFSVECFQNAHHSLLSWIQRVQAIAPQVAASAAPIYRLWWTRKNAEAGERLSTQVDMRWKAAVAPWLGVLVLLLLLSLWYFRS